MNSSRLLYIVFSLLAVVSCDTSDNVDPLYEDYFIKTIGTDGDQEGVDLLVNDDNTITLLGNSIHPDGIRRIYFVKTDLKGNVLLQKELGGTAEYAKDIEPVNGGYIILSNVLVSPERYDIKLIRTDADGNKQDSVLFQQLTDQFGNSVTPLTDGRFYVAGNTRDISSNNASLPSDSEEPLIIELNNDLTTKSIDRIGGSTVGMCIKVFENSGSYTYGGYSDELHKGNTSLYNMDFFFRTFRDVSNQLFTEYAGDNVAEEKMQSFVRMPNGNFVGIGTEISGTGVKQLFISSIYNARNGIDYVPVKIYSGSIGTSNLEGITGYASFKGVFVYILADEINAADQTRDIRLFKVNAQLGTEVWSQQFGAPDFSESSNALAELPNGDIVILGTVNLINQNKMTLIKVNENGKFQ